MSTSGTGAEMLDNFRWLVERYGYARRENGHQNKSSHEWMAEIEAEYTDLQSRLDSALLAAKAFENEFTVWFRDDCAQIENDDLPEDMLTTLIALRAILSGPEEKETDNA